MASIGHVFVGLALARAHDSHAPSQSSLRTRVACALAFPALALLPDGDVVAFALRIPYEHELGHRGASHSLAFAVVVGALAGFVMSRVRRDASLAWCVGACVAAVGSHGILDAFTDGGLGVALAWPLSDARCFAPWRPIPVAPIGVKFFTSAWGLRVAATELAMFAPFLAYALLWPRIRTWLRT